MRLAINGFGRIGRAVLKIALEKNIKIVAINDVHGVKDAAYLLKHDSVYGIYDEKVEIEKDNLLVGKNKIKILSERDPLKLPWKSLNVDIVIESTGVFKDKASCMMHIKAGAKKVILTAPSKDKLDITIVPGVNSSKLKKHHQIMSVASCITNCLTPMVKVLEESFGIKRAVMTTVHAYTNDQALHDSSHSKPRRGRMAAVNVVPTTTGASEAVIEVFPALLGKITGLAIRVPVITGSLVDLSAELKKSPKEEEINKAFKKYSKGTLKEILEYSEDELVSSDIIKNPHSCIFDSLLTQATGNLIKVLGWYDNEYGYSNRVVDVVSMLKKL